MKKANNKTEQAAKIKPGRESVILPLDLRDFLVDLTSDIWKNSRIRISKNSIFVELVRLLKSSKISTKRVSSSEDITAQLVEYIKKRK